MIASEEYVHKKAYIQLLIKHQNQSKIQQCPVISFLFILSFPLSTGLITTAVNSSNKIRFMHLCSVCVSLCERVCAWFSALWLFDWVFRVVLLTSASGTAWLYMPQARPGLCGCGCESAQCRARLSFVSMTGYSMWGSTGDMGKMIKINSSQTSSTPNVWGLTEVTGGHFSKYPFPFDVTTAPS